MTVLRTTALIDAPETVVREALASLGPLARIELAGRGATVTGEVIATAGGTLLTCSLRWHRFGVAVDMALWRRRLLARLGVVISEVRRRAQARLVVAAAIVADSRVLAAQRAYPAELAGRWELPGGRVEPGEAPAGAVVREIREELGAVVRTGARLGGGTPLPGGLVLQAYVAHLVAGEPAAREHRALRWLSAGELDAVDWLDADRALLPALRTVLGG